MRKYGTPSPDRLQIFLPMTAFLMEGNKMVSTLDVLGRIILHIALPKAALLSACMEFEMGR